LEKRKFHKVPARRRNKISRIPFYGTMVFAEGFSNMDALPEHPKKAQPEGELVPPSVPGAQPEPLTELSEEERAEWRKFTSRLPADWFPCETWPMLAQLCRHICQARWFGEALQEVRAGILDPTDDEQLEKIERLIRCHDREGKAIVSLMVKLRLTSQQRIEDDGVAQRRRERAADEHPEAAPWAASGRRIAAGVERTQ
jgi:hypothetical protein